MAIKSVIALKMQSFLLTKWPKMAGVSWQKKYGPPKPPLLCKWFKIIYIQNIGHIWGYIYADSWDFWKCFNGSDKTKLKKLWLKMSNNIFFTFWGTSKNWRLDLKVNADPSWLLVFKNSLQRCFSFKSYWVIDVWTQCKKKHYGGGAAAEGGAGPTWVWGSD